MAARLTAKLTTDRQLAVIVFADFVFRLRI
jgi:hypothetical protein